MKHVFNTILLCSFVLVTQKSYSDDGDNSAAYEQEGFIQKSVPAPVVAPAPEVAAQPQTAPAVKEALQIDVSGHVRMDGTFNDSSNYQDNLRLKATDLKIKAGTNDVKLNLLFEYNQRLRVDGKDATLSDFNIGSFVKEVYVSIKAAENVLVKVGKQEVAFGQDLNKMPIYHDNPTHNISEYTQVIGVTGVWNTKSITSALDSVEVSAFETGKNNLKIDTDQLDGIAARITKEIQDGTTLEASYLHAGNGSAANEDRVSLGVVSHLDEYTAWVEGLYFNNFGGLGNSNYGVTGGVSRELGPGELVLECTRIAGTQTQEAVGYKCKAVDRVMFGPEIRFTQNDNGPNDFSAGMRVEVTFGK